MIEVRFVGGPADGMTHEYPGDEPPNLLEVYAPRFAANDDAVAIRCHYETRLSPFDDGPVWIAIQLEADQ